MKRKILSLVLVLSMLIGLLPGIAVAGNTLDSTLIYNFTVSAIADESIIVTSADGKNTKSVQWELVTSTSQLNSEVSTGLWTFVARPGFYNGALYSGNVQARVDLANIEANGTVLKTSFAENATYSAGVAYTKNAANGRTNVYFVPVAEATANNWNMATAAGVNAAIAASEDSASSVALAASVDMHSNATDANPCEGNTFDVTAGEYYIVISVRKGCTETANGRYFTMIKSLTLTRAEKEETAKSLKYEFTLAGAGEDVSSITDTNSVLKLKKKNITSGDGNDASETGGDWTYMEDSGGYYTNAAGPDYLQQLTENGFWGYAASTSYNPLGMNGVVFKLNVPTAGTYTPKLNAIQTLNSPVYYAYLIDDDINGKAYTNYSGSSYTFNFESDTLNSVQVITSMLRGGFAYTFPTEAALAVKGSLVAGSAAGTTPTELTGDALSLEAGTYYLLVSQESTGRFYTYLNSFELVPGEEEAPEPVFSDISVTFGENETVYVGSKLIPAVTCYAGETEIDGTDAVITVDIKENDEGALIKTTDGTIRASGEGKATVSVSATIDDITVTKNATVTVAVDASYAGESITYMFWQNAYDDGIYSVTVEGAEHGTKLSEADLMNSVAAEYGTERPWAFAAAAASRPDSKYKYFAQNSSYMDLSALAGEWTAFKVKIPAAGKYSVDLAGFTYANGGLAEVYMLPYTADMTFSSITENIATYMSADNFVAEADFNGTAKATVNQTNAGTFIADEGLDWSAGYAEYLMIVKSCNSKINSSKYAVLLYSVGLVGSGGIDTAEAVFDNTTVGVGESVTVTGVTAENAAGGAVDLSDAYIYHSVHEEDKDILEISADGKSFKALAEGTATVETVVLTDAGRAACETEITVDNAFGIMNAYLYNVSLPSVGDELAFVTRLELNNRRVISGGELVSFEIVNSEPEGVLEISADGKKVTAVAAGKADVKAKLSARGNIYETDTISIAVGEVEMNYSTNFDIDFRKGAYAGDAASNLTEITKYSAVRNWIFHSISGVSSQYSTIALATTNPYMQIVWNGVGESNYIAFKVIFPSTGNYAADVTGFCRNRSAKLDMFVIPATSENEAKLQSLLDVSGEYYFGSADTYRATAGSGITNSFGAGNIASAGEYFVVFRTAAGLAAEAVGGFGDAWYPLYISFTNGSALKSAGLATESGSTVLEVDDSAALTPVLTGADGSELPYDASVEVIWKSDDESVATVSRDGIVTGINEGNVTITATIFREGATAVAKLDMQVVDSSGIDIEKGIRATAGDSIYAYATTQIELEVAMNSGKWVKIPSDYITYNVLSGGDAATVSEDGTVTGIRVGTIIIEPAVSPSFKDGIESIAVLPVTIEVVWDATVNPQIYTLEERENAIKNASRYTWARDKVEDIKESADVWVEKLDWLYNNMIPEGLPRYYHVGHKYDPKKFFCRFCNCNIGLDYGSYGWSLDPMGREWKIQCPDCKRVFPSNDFGSFYKLGLSDNGTTWSMEKALQKHHEMFVCENGANCTCEGPGGKRGTEAWYSYYGYGVEGGFLTNDLYKDSRDSRWGVDDSLGYLAKYDTSDPAHDPSYTEGENGLAMYVYNGAKYPVQHAYIAYYIHEGIWYGAGGVSNSALIKNAISDLRLAFVYTGDAKYGRAGAILLDRLADMYPHFDWYRWANFRGDSYRGNIADPVWSTGIAQIFAEAYDAFLPIYNDPYVVKYLSENGAIYEEDENGEYKLDEEGNRIPVNLKDSPGAIRKNAEDNILLTIYDDTRKGKIWGNFGMHQSAVVAAAIALNRMPETGEMLEWIMRDGTGYNTGEEREELIEGGYVMKNLIEEVCRDGIGNENAPGYNRHWITNLIEIAKYLAEYEGYDGANLFENPKFTNMFTALIRLTLGGYYGAQIGDSGAVASTGIVMNLSDSLVGFKYTGDRTLAQAIYLYNGNTTDGLYGSILDDDPEQLAKDIESIIEEDGELSLRSDMLTGHGFSVLRAGSNNESASILTASNTIRDFGIYFGANTGHGHYDTLNLHMSAFGLNVAPDLGYPEQTGTQPNRMEWVDAAISHNTVVVDEKEQGSIGTAGTPYHFDDSGRVKIMDVSANDVYSMVDEYRRSVVMVEVDDEISYGVDFFRINGGDDHLYSFHSQSDELTAVSGLDDLYHQPMYTDEEGNRYGVYAGADVKYGPDPNGVSNGKYPHGYTWLYDVRRYNSIENNFSVEWNVKDWRKQMLQKRDVRLRLTMVSDEPVNEVTFATALPPQTANNKEIGELDYLLVRRKGNNLDTTFTTVIEPYENGKQYIETIEKVPMVRAAGVKPGINDAFSAVKVTLKNGRIDYVIYSNNSEIDYVVDDKFNFRGFVGVVSLEKTDDEEKIIYNYLNDGEILEFAGAESTEKLPAYTGKIKSFTDKLQMENFVTYTPDEGQVVDTEALCGKYVYIDNDGVQNGAYKIENAEINDEGDVVLSLGMVSLIRSFVDSGDMSLGYVFNVEEGQTLRIPLSSVEDTSPVFAQPEDYTTSAGSSITIPLNACSTSGKEIEIKGTSLPRGMSISSDGQTLTWKPDSSQIGENHVAVTASDGMLETTVHFTVTVYGSTTGGSSLGDSNTSTDSSGTSGTSGGGGGGGGGGAADTGNSSGSAEDGDITQSDEKNTGTAPDASGETENLRFTDLGNCAWAADAINSLAEDGVIKGTGSSTFSPAANITRADFALLLVRAFKLSSDNTENFADVMVNDYYASELAIARNTGIVNGIGENKFAPRNHITRQDMMVIVYRALLSLGSEPSQSLTATALPEGEPSGGEEYADFTSVAPYARKAVSALIGAGLVNGKSGLIAPTDYTTRAEVAVLIKRILDYTNK